MVPWYNNGVGAVDIAAAGLASMFGHAMQPGAMVHTPLAQALAPYAGGAPHLNTSALASFAHNPAFRPHAQQPIQIDPRVVGLMAASRMKDLPQVLMGIDSGSVAASGVFSVARSPATPLRITKVVCDQSQAQFFTLTRLTLGRLELIVGSDGIPATAFSPDSAQPPIQNPILYPGVNVIVGGTNDDTGAAHRQKTMVYGIDLDPQCAT